MTDHPPPTDVGSPASRRLDSWKDIASYLNRDVSTVQRWEKREGMPVHRHLHGKLGSVYAFSEELDAWWRSRQVRLRGAAELEGARPDSGGWDAERRRWRVRLAGLALFALAAVAAAALWMGNRAGSSSAHPLEDARFARLTDFEGKEEAAALSRDGRFVAFLADRDGAVDVWVTQAGTGRFRNLTEGAAGELINRDVRALRFSPDGAFVATWMRERGSESADVSIWKVSTMGGSPVRFLERAAELDWSSDGTRVVYHTAASGDPMFVSEGSGSERAIFQAAAGLHNHYPLWSPDDRWIWFVHGSVADRMDLWRIPASGGPPERMTFHESRVSHPAFRDRRTLLYLATDGDGDGPWLHALDLDRQESRRVSVGTERYTSLSASADGRKLAVTVTNPRRSLWRVPVGEEEAGDAEATRIPVPIVGGRAPRLGPGYLLYVSSLGDTESLWKLVEGAASELWRVPEGRIVGGPAIARDGARIAFAADEHGIRRLHVMNADGSGLRTVATGDLEPRSSPAWSPDGQALAVAGMMKGRPVLARVSLADPPRVTPLASETAADPAWSPDGEIILYAGAEVGTRYSVRAVRPRGGAAAESRFEHSRGVRRIVFLPDGKSVVVLRGDMTHKNFWEIDLDGGRERRLTDFGPDVVVRDFDLSPDGREIVFDREQDDSDVVLIETDAIR